jgi:glyoxylase-like metal-dependent hydrolase (beta-lactamase superfamily II)
MHFAWNGEMWRVDRERSTSQVIKLSRKFYSPVSGDGSEEVKFAGDFLGRDRRSAGSVSVAAGGREVARIDWQGAETVEPQAFPAGNPTRDAEQLIKAEEAQLSELAPHLFVFNLTNLNSRVVVGEFSDHLLVFEGAHNDRVTEVLADRLRERFAKPVRYFAFSHLHGQYVAGVRTWLREGATVCVPPTTAPLIEKIAGAPHQLALGGARAGVKSPPMLTVAKSWRHEDAVNAVELFNIVSDHTDEYLICWFPRQKVLLTGDLLFYRPGKMLSGRSAKLSETVRTLGLSPERFVATWPLDGFGTHNIVTAEEIKQATPSAK